MTLTGCEAGIRQTSLLDTRGTQVKVGTVCELGLVRGRSGGWSWSPTGDAQFPGHFVQGGKRRGVGGGFGWNSLDSEYTITKTQKNAARVYK